MQENILTQLIFPGQEQDSKSKFSPAHFLSQQSFMLPLTQARILYTVVYYIYCSLFSGQVPYVLIIFMKDNDL